VDYIELTGEKPTKFKNSGVAYSQRYKFGKQKAFVSKL
jgi:hypothetical protein